MVALLSCFLFVEGMPAAAFAKEKKQAAPSVAPTSEAKRETSPAPPMDYKQYLEFFEKVYSTMSENYYFPVTREGYDRFITMFDTRIFPQLQEENKTANYVKWRSAAYLVDYLKDKEDIFSAFYPPKAADDYEKEALGKRLDLGIEGEITPDGYLVKRIEPRSDAFEKGLREGDVLLAITKKDVKKLTLPEIQDLLTPLENAVVALEYRSLAENIIKTIEVISKEYFKQSVFMIPVPVPGVFCLEIEHFNRMTSDDMTRFMSYILDKGESSLIIDLRGNPGGPPLAAREISSFFLTPDEEFAYFQRKGGPKSELYVPRIPERFRYHGEMVILVNEKSGSASELFSGVLQAQGRAVLMGTNTAGQVFLKSMFRFDDDSMLLLVTARGFRRDGKVFPFKGLEPNVRMTDPEHDLVMYAAQYLAQRREIKKKEAEKNQQNKTEK